MAIHTAAAIPHEVFFACFSMVPYIQTQVPQRFAWFWLGLAWFCSPVAQDHAGDRRRPPAAVLWWDLAYQLPLITCGSFQSKTIDRITILQKKSDGGRRSKTMTKSVFQNTAPAEYLAEAETI